MLNTIYIAAALLEDAQAFGQLVSHDVLWALRHGDTVVVQTLPRDQKINGGGSTMTDIPTPTIANTVADHMAAANALFPTPAPADNQVERSLSDDERRVVAEVRLLALQLHDKLLRLPGGVTDEINSAKEKLREAMSWALRHVHHEQRPPV